MKHVRDRHRLKLTPTAREMTVYVLLRTDKLIFDDDLVE